jgi:hypothetical protein
MLMQGTQVILLLLGNEPKAILKAWDPAALCYRVLISNLPVGLLEVVVGVVGVEEGVQPAAK